MKKVVLYLFCSECSYEGERKGNTQRGQIQSKVQNIEEKEEKDKILKWHLPMYKSTQSLINKVNTNKGEDRESLSEIDKREKEKRRKRKDK